MPTGPFSRSQAISKLSTESFDVLVIGGGITGAGVALDAAARGLRTALVEKDDFASGTSSESSKLVHGGLRYLQQYEVGLVFQSLAERQILLKNAPHLVQPQMFVIPLFGSGAVLDKAMARTYSLGLWLYDLFGGFRIGHLHRRATSAEVRAHLPTLRVDELVAGFIYYDAHTDDARLTLDVMRTAADYGAVVVNHAPVSGLLKNAAGAVDGVRIVPAGTPGDALDIHASSVVNATGVWADATAQLDEPGQRRLRPAKGVHIAVPSSVLPCDAAVVLPAPHGNVFVIPWGEMTYVGTTDTDYVGDLDHPSVDRAEAEYLLDAVNAAVTKPVRASDITGTWAGLRPLLATGSRWRRRPSTRTADLSRRHKVLVSRSGLITITGGKLTTYRKMAQDTVNVVVKRLDRGSRHCPTKHLSLHGAPGAGWQPSVPSQIDIGPDTLQHLVSRYGSDTSLLIDLIVEDASLGERVLLSQPFLGAEVLYAVRHEMAITLEDVLSRRLRVLFLDAEAARKMAPAVAGLMAGELHWSDEDLRSQLEDFEVLATGRLSMLAEATSVGRSRG